MAGTHGPAWWSLTPVHETEYHLDVQPATATQPLLEVLAGRGHRLTGQRRAVAQLIAARRGHFTAADLEATARERELPIGRATVFRALDLLAAIGVIERIDLPSGEHAWVACEPEHHHHVVCASCGRTADFDDAGLASVVAAVARRTGFTIDAHRVELFGRCSDCTSRTLS